MDSFEIVANRMKEIHDPVERRKAIFSFVQAIPYGVGIAQNAEDVLVKQHGDCGTKSALFRLLMEVVGERTRTLHAFYKLRDVPDEVRYIPDRLDVHHAPQVWIDGAWITADPTYDPSLKAAGFRVFEWDGVTATSLAEDALMTATDDERNPAFEKAFEDFTRKLDEACRTYPDEMAAYTRKFNERIKSVRSEK